MTTSDEEIKKWYVMRDLKRPNALLPAYKQLDNERIEAFTPMQWRIKTQRGAKQRERVPFMQDLLFVHDTRSTIDRAIEKIPTLQYRYVRGGSYKEAMTVADRDMDRFIKAVSTTDTPCYYAPGELTPAMYGRRIRIIGGPLNDYEGYLLTTRGSRVKRLLVELPSLLSVSIEVNPEFIELL